MVSCGETLGRVVLVISSPTF